MPAPRPRTWVLPNRNTLGLAAVLAAMWYAGASQSNGAAYLLCFILGALAAVSLVHAWANLRGVVIAAGSILPSFAGEEFAVPLVASSDRHRAHFTVQASARGATVPARFEEIPADGEVRASLICAAKTRGCFTELRLRVTSLYPIGFFSTSRTVTVAQSYCVYPKPAGTLPLPRALAPTRHPRDGTRVEGDDFGGVRAWQPGESQRHIDWKAAARGQPLLVKQWTGEADEIMRFDWHALDALDDEARLSQLARWIVVAERAGHSYGLSLPGRQIPPACGEAHFHECLRALAAFKTADGGNRAA